MIIAIRNTHWLFIIFTILFFPACQKNISTDYETGTSELAMKVNNWLENQKQESGTSGTNAIHSNTTNTIKNPSHSKRNENIDLLKENLEYNARLQSELNSKFNYLIIPIKDKVKTVKRIDKNASLSLILITDKIGNLISGSIACYLPKDGKSRGYSAVNITAEILKGKAPKDSGIVKFMDITGRRLNEFGFNMGRISSYGVIKQKINDQTQVLNIYACTDWYLITTYYDDYYNIIEQTSEYIGTTCQNCDDGEYGSLCPGNGNGGGGNNGGNTIIDPTLVYSSQTIKEIFETSEGDNTNYIAEDGSPDAAPNHLILWPGIKYIYSWDVVVGYNYFNIPITLLEVIVYPATVESTQADIYDTYGHPCRRKINLFALKQNGFPTSGLVGYASWEFMVHADYYHNGIPWPSRNWQKNHAKVVTP